MDILINAVMFLTVSFASSNDNRWNYLLLTTAPPPTMSHIPQPEMEYAMAFSSSQLQLKTGQTLVARVSARCELAWTLDETPYHLRAQFPYGIPRRVYVCNAISIYTDVGDASIHVDGKTYNNGE